MSFELRPYQRDIIDRATNTEGSVLIEAPTGSGKSVMAREIARREIDKGGVVLAVAPKITLLDQLAATFADLRPQIIHQAKRYDKRSGLFVSTIQTAHRRELNFTPTMIIIDEVHHGFSGKMIANLLNEFDGRLIGLSATPYDKEGEPLQGFDLHIDDYDMRYMIEHGYLVPLRCYEPIEVDLTGIRITGGDYNQGDLAKKFNTIDSVMQVVAATKEMIKARKQALAFTVTINHAQALAEAYNDAGIPAAAMHSKLADDEKSAIMEAFKRGELKVLTNPDMLTTGFDHPPTDTVVLARATKSANLYRQMVGRVLRPSDGKIDAVMLDCAGVIADLGFPTEPIEPKRKRRRNATQQKKRCEACDSERIYRRIDDKKSAWICAACGHEEAIEPSGHKCEACARVWGNEGRYIVRDGTLYLSCDCGHEMAISHATPTQELKAIFDPVTVEAIQKRVVADYARWLIDRKGVDFITTQECIRQIKALTEYIQKHPDRILKFDERLITFDDWRVIPPYYYAEPKPRVIKHLEPKEERHPSTAEKLKKSLKSATSFTEAVEAYNGLMEIEGKPQLTANTVEMVKQQIAKSWIKDIDKLAATRLHNIYKEGREGDYILTFVPYVEKRRRQIKANSRAKKERLIKDAMV